MKRVMVKANRICKICGKTITKGEKAIQTLRCTKWSVKVSHICLDCYKKQLIIYQPKISNPKTFVDYQINVGENSYVPIKKGCVIFLKRRDNK